MISFNTISLFIFVFSTLISLRTIIRFVMSLSSQSPTKLVMSKKELITNGLALSYIITYILS